MAMKRMAFAPVATRQVKRSQWDTFRSIQAVKTPSNVRVAYANTPNKDVLSMFDPNRYVLTHSTIIASVDTVEVPDADLGEDLWEKGRRVTRLWSDYRINKETQKYINSNSDAWERRLLLQSFWTFIGGYNYQEHIQDPELSKGILLDAVSRDLGDTVYIDLLVATDRVHTQLVKDIIRGVMKTMSMGCSIQFSICTQCGNVATDEEHMCSHIGLMKGESFVTEDGETQVIAELCGHREVEDSVTFFEASWVEIPAFEGAHVRTVLYVPPDLSLDASIHQSSIITTQKAPSLSAMPSTNWMDSFKIDTVVLSKTFGNRAAFSFGEDAEEGSEAPPEDEKTYMDQVLEESKTLIKDRLKNDIKQELVDDLNQNRDDAMKKQDPMPEAENTNDNIVKAKKIAAMVRSMSLSGTSRVLVFHAALRIANPDFKSRKAFKLNQRALVYGMMANDRVDGKTYDSNYYALLMKSDAKGSYAKFAKLCEIHLKRPLTKGEGIFLSKRSQMLKKI